MRRARARRMRLVAGWFGGGGGTVSGVRPQAERAQRRRRGAAASPPGRTSVEEIVAEVLELEPHRVPLVVLPDLQARLGVARAQPLERPLAVAIRRPVVGEVGQHARRAPPLEPRRELASVQPAAVEHRHLRMRARRCARGREARLIREAPLRPRAVGSDVSLYLLLGVAYARLHLGESQAVRLEGGRVRGMGGACEGRAGQRACLARGGACRCSAAPGHSRPRWGYLHNGAPVRGSRFSGKPDRSAPMVVRTRAQGAAVQRALACPGTRRLKRWPAPPQRVRRARRRRPPRAADTFWPARRACGIAAEGWRLRGGRGARVRVSESLLPAHRHRLVGCRSRPAAPALRGRARACA